MIIFFVKIQILLCEQFNEIKVRKAMSRDCSMGDSVESAARVISGLRLGVII